MATNTKGYEIFKWFNPTENKLNSYAPNQKTNFNIANKEYFNVNPTPIGTQINSFVVSTANERDFKSALRFLELAKDDSYYTLFKTQVHTGARVGDLVKVKWKDIDFEKGVIYIHHGKGSGGKTGLTGTKKRRVVPLTESLKKDLLAEKGDRKTLTGYVWSSIEDKKKPAVKGTITKRMDKILDTLDENGNRIFDRTAWAGEKTHKLRKAFATFALQADFPISYIREILGHTDNKMQVFYNSDALDAKLNQIVSIDITEEGADILNTHRRHLERMDILENLYDKHALYNEHNFQARKQQTKVDTELDLNEKINTLDNELKGKKSNYSKIATRHIVLDNISPDLDVVSPEDEAERLIKIEAGKKGSDLDIDIPIGETDKIPEDFPDPAVREKVAQATRRGWAVGPVVGAVMDAQHAAAIDNAYDLDSQTKLKKNIILDEDIAPRIFNETLTQFHAGDYNDYIDIKINRIVGESGVYRYDATDMVDWDGTTWQKDSKGLDEIFSIANRSETNRATAQISLDQDVLKNILFHIEEYQRFDYFAKRIAGEMNYTIYPDHVGKTDAARYKYQRKMLDYMLDNFKKENKGKTFDLGLTRSAKGAQNYTAAELAQRIQNHFVGLSDRNEFTAIDSDFFKVLVDSNPQAFPEVSERVKKMYPPEMIYRMRIEPYLQFLNEQGIIDDEVWERAGKVLKDGEFEVPLKDKIGYTPTGKVDQRVVKAERLSIPHLNTTFFDEDFQKHYEYPDIEITVGTDGKQVIRTTNILEDIPNVEIENIEGGQTTTTIKGGYNPNYDWKLVKKATKNAGELVLKTGKLSAYFLVPFYGVASKTAFAAEAALEIGTRAYFADMGSIGEGILGNVLLNADKYGFVGSADPKIVKEKLDKLNPRQLEQLIRGTAAPEKRVGTFEIYKEKGKDILRNLAGAEALQISANQGDTNFFSGAVEELNQQEIEGPATDIADRITRQGIKDYIPDLEKKVTDFENTFFGRVLEDNEDPLTVPRVQTGLAGSVPLETFPTLRDSYMQDKERLNNYRTEQLRPAYDVIEDIKNTEVDLVPNTLKDEQQEAQIDSGESVKISTEEQINTLLTNQQEGENDAVNARLQTG